MTYRKSYLLHWVDFSQCHRIIFQGVKIDGYGEWDPDFICAGIASANGVPRVVYFARNPVLIEEFLYVILVSVLLILAILSVSIFSLGISGRIEHLTGAMTGGNKK